MRINIDDPVKKNLLFAIFLMLILYAIGITFYQHFEHWSFIDSAYFLTATFSTVGYGDITPKTDIGKTFTIFIIWSGVSVGFFLIYSLIAYRETAIDSNLLSKLRIFGILRSNKDKDRK